MTKAKILAKNFAALLTGNVVGQVLYFIGLLYLAKVLSPASFGIWNLASAWMLHFMRAGEFGLEVVGLRGIVRNPAQSASWIGSVVATRLVLVAVLLLTAAGLVSLGVIPSDAESVVLILLLTLIPMAILTEWAFEAHQIIMPITLARIAKGLIFVALVFPFVSGVDHQNRAAWIYVASVTIPSMGLMVFAVRKFSVRGGDMTARGGLSLLRNAAPLGTATMLSNYNIFAGTLISGYMVSNVELGYFTAAHRMVVFIWAYVIATSHRVLLPTLTTYFHDVRERYTQFIKKFFRLSVLAAATFALLGFLMSDWIIGLLYPDEYGASSGVLQWLVWGLAFAVARTIFEIALIAGDEHKRYMWGVTLVSIAYTIVTPILVWAMGITGAALAVVVVECGYCCWLMISFPFSTTDHLAGDFLRPLLAVGVALVPPLMLAESLPLPVVVILSLGVYAAALGVVKGVTLEDIRLLRRIVAGNLETR